ncbi:hypothetical protein [Micromonospora sp. NPDC047074]|uniref:hypothetical protein n=1 Tax=Micromonospora sp. NPDC047074 TaxID=3154339 RepID=UPI0033C0A7E2
MARRGWGGSTATAVGVAAGAGAAQLGFGYGLGIINWAPADATAGATAWVAGLIWGTWIAATSTVFGAVCAQRLRDRAPVAGPAADPAGDPAGAAVDPAGATVAPAETTVDPAAAAVGPADTAVDRAESVVDRAGQAVDRAGTAGGPAGVTTGGPTGGVLGSVALAVAAGVGALVTVLLVAVPARTAVADVGSPRNVAATYAAIGVLVGVLAALWALRSRAAASNVIATVGWLWLLAVVAVVDGVLAGRGLTSAQLGIWQLGPDDGRYWIRDYFYWPGALLSLGSALVIGVLAARRDARHADHRVGAAVSGAAGPLLVATAYFLAVPRLTAISPEQVSAHLIAPYAVIIGVGGAALFVALAQRAARRAAARRSVTVPRQRTDEPADLAEGREPASGRHAARTGHGDTDSPGTDRDVVPTSGQAFPGPVTDRGQGPAAASKAVGTTRRRAGTPAAPPARDGEAMGGDGEAMAGDGQAVAGEPTGEESAAKSPTTRRPRSGRRTG